jgi:hypothetical protein
MRTLTTYEIEAIKYAERHGICEYHLQGDKMVYYTSWPIERRTYKAVVNLDTQEETRTELRGYYKPYDSLIAGRYQANYEA